MKKKSKIAAIAGLIFVLAAGSVCASVYNNEYTVVPYDLSQEAEVPDIKNTDKLKLVAEKIKGTVADEEDAYMQTLNYVYAMEKYAATDEEQDHLHDLVLNGADADMIRKIYVFLQDTSYSIDMVEKIYNIAIDIYEDDEFWVETAFNGATDNVHGVLDKEQVTAYLEQGLTVEDITTANVLCRKGVYTITEILDKCIAGVEWSDIFDEVYSDVTESDTLLKVKGFKKAKKIKGKQAPGDMLTAMQLSKMTKEKPEVFLTEDKTNVEEYRSSITADFIDKSEEILNNIDVKKPKQKREKADEKILDSARENGVSEEQINQYFAEGFSDVDIKNAASVAKDKGTDVDTVMKKRKKGMSINEIINEGGEKK